ncbi:hypothetical protein AVEN_61533-1 [Araneus ventricosus]|uniref:Uncharacterized protein n=1 Tax=Araneus ventricosus TaxID=182803 RepID=A0A4Y2I9H5_ARAVE|nr:hypothetical protein AVEN_61533-1 [Araneus ventricosus]
MTVDTPDDRSAGIFWRHGRQSLRETGDQPFKISRMQHDFVRTQVGSQSSQPLGDLEETCTKFLNLRHERHEEKNGNESV